MVNPSDRNVEQNVSRRNKSLLQRLKEEALTQELPKSMPNEVQAEKNIEKKPQIKVEEKLQKVIEASKKSQRDLLNISSDSSERQAYLGRRSIVQEHLLHQQCKKTCNKKNSSYSNAYSSHTISSTSRPSHHRHYTHNNKSRHNTSSHHVTHNNTQNTEEDDDFNSGPSGALHLKGPLQHEENEKIFFEDRGRMEHVEWNTVINEGNKRSDCVRSRSSLKHQGKGAIPKTLNPLPVISDEFSNFVHNSCIENNIVFDDRNNKKIRSTSESPLIKLQRQLSRFSPIDAIPMTEEIRQKFKPQSSSMLHIVELIEMPIKKTDDNENLTSKLRYALGIEEKPEINLNDATRTEIKVKTKRDDYINTLEDKENITPEKTGYTPASKNTKKKDFLDYDDEMFQFVKPEKQSSSLSYFNSNEDNVNDEVQTSTLVSFYGKFGKSGLDKSLDSDDTSAASSSDLDNLSISRKSTISKYEVFIKKLGALDSVSSEKKQKLPRPKLSNIIKNKSVTAKQELEEKESFMKENLTRFLESSDSAVNVAKNNEIIKGKVISKRMTELKENVIKETKPLLKEVSTQYYTQSSKEIVDLDEKTNKVTKNIEINILSAKSKIEVIGSDKIQVKNYVQRDATIDDLNKQVVTNQINDAEINCNFKPDPEIEELTDTSKITQVVTDSINDTEIICNIKKSSDIDEVSDHLKSKATNFINNSVNLCNVKNSSNINEIVKYSNTAMNESDCNTIESIYLSFKSSEESEESISAKISSTVVAELHNENYRMNNGTSLSSDDDYIITNHTNFSESSVTIQEIEPNSESNIDNNNNLKVNTPIVSVEDYKDIDSEEEFDIVGLEQFTGFTEIVNSIKAVQNAVKAQVTNEIEYNNDDDNNSNNNNNNNNKSSSESSFKCSNNSSSNVSNLDADDEMSSGQSGFFEKENIFEGVHIDDSIWKNDRPNYFNPAPKLNDKEKNAEESQVSKRMKKMRDALKNYQEKKQKDTEVSKDKYQNVNNLEKSENNAMNESSESSSRPRNSILHQIKEKKLHLNCKPVDKKKLNLFKP